MKGLAEDFGLGDAIWCRYVRPRIRSERLWDMNGELGGSLGTEIPMLKEDA